MTKKDKDDSDNKDKEVGIQQQKKLESLSK